MQDVEEFRAEVRDWLADNLVGEFAALKGPRRARARARGIRGTPGVEPASRGRGTDLPGLAGRTRRPWAVDRAPGGVLRGVRPGRRAGKVNHFGEELLGPTLIAFGTPEQQQRFLPRILDVTELWCQGYSEPGAGSDLANVSTTAELDGDQWVINGQKVWTSLAHLSQWCFVIARTEKGSKRHAGLSYLLVPLDQPGVQVRPIVQITGTSEFNEVFFDDARTDADMVVGAPGDGWRVAMGTLTFERGVSTLGQQIVYARELSRLAELAQRNGAADDPFIRERLTRAWTGLRAMRSYALATMDVEQPGPGQRVEVVVGQLASRSWRAGDGRDRQGRHDVDRRRIRRMAAAVPVHPRRHHLRRVQRDPAQHHCRASARLTAGRSRDESVRSTERGCRTRTSGRQGGCRHRGGGHRHRFGDRAPGAGRGRRRGDLRPPRATAGGDRRRTVRARTRAGSRRWCAT